MHRDATTDDVMRERLGAALRSASAMEYNRLEDVVFQPIGNLDLILALAKEYEFIKEPLTAEQKKDLVDIIYDPKK